MSKQAQAAVASVKPAPVAAKPANKAIAAAPAASKPAPRARAPKAEQFSLAEHAKTMWIRILLARDPNITSEELRAQLAAGGLDINDATIATIRIDTLRSFKALQIAGRLPATLKPLPAKAA